MSKAKILLVDDTEKAIINEEEDIRLNPVKSV
jgi:hypothetical protein